MLLPGTAPVAPKGPYRVSKRVELRIAIAVSRFGAGAGTTEFVAPTTKVADFHSEARGLLLVRLTLYREHGVGGGYLLQLLL